MDDCWWWGCPVVSMVEGRREVSLTVRYGAGFTSLKFTFTEGMNIWIHLEGWEVLTFDPVVRLAHRPEPDFELFEKAQNPSLSFKPQRVHLTRVAHTTAAPYILLTSCYLASFYSILFYSVQLLLLTMPRAGGGSGWDGGPRVAFVNNVKSHARRRELAFSTANLLAPILQA